ncbi:hypothetical protein MSHRCOH1_00720 [Candidatus Ornithobacterium hominis]|nr:hypothetical protein MSHRCOH1_00720 [Candidatus Ornithobacterium hominis]
MKKNYAQFNKKTASYAETVFFIQFFLRLKKFLFQFFLYLVYNINFYRISYLNVVKVLNV